MAQGRKRGGGGREGQGVMEEGGREGGREGEEGRDGKYGTRSINSSCV